MIELKNLIDQKTKFYNKNGNFSKIPRQNINIESNPLTFMKPTNGYESYSIRSQL
jgi:hypothetical protein